jgi:hypothetical protein
MKVVRELENGFTIVQTNYEGWISFWIKDPHGEDVETFASVARAMKYWEEKGGIMVDKSESPERLKAHKEARKLCKRMGINLDSLSKEEQEEWIEECL